MFKKIQFTLVAACALFSVAANSTNSVAMWWTDHEPNHVIGTDAPTPEGETLPDSWWTDHEPNHIVAPEDDSTAVEINIGEVTPNMWWTDHEPNH